MPIAALLSATREAREPGVPLRATFWLAGRTLIERQARLAAAAGVKRVIIMVETMPGELAAAIERLRREGLDVATARNAREAAAALPGGGRMIMMADGFVGARSHLERLTAADRPALLTVADRGFDERYERIDGDTRWAGVALVDAELLRDASLMPAEWDVLSTLLRRALQTGVTPLPIATEREAAELAIVERSEDFAELQRRMLSSIAWASPNWVSRYLLAPVELLATRAVMTKNVGPTTIGATAVALTTLSVIAFAFDWRWLGLVPLILAMPLEGIALRLARLRLKRIAANAWWRVLLPVLEGAALVTLAYRLTASDGWGILLTAVIAILFLVALRREIGTTDVKGALFLADRHSVLLIMLALAPASQWGAGILVLLAYAAASFFWAQQQVHRRQD
jgi:hypothetical protein